MVLATRTAPPLAGGCSRRSPDARAASAGTGAASPSMISMGRPGNWSESIPTRKLPGFGVKVTSVASPTAMGSESPAL